MKGITGSDNVTICQEGVNEAGDADQDCGLERGNAPGSVWRRLSG